MNILQRYIAAQFFKNTAITMSGFIAIYMLIDFFEKFDKFMGAGKPVSLVIKYFLLSIPFILDQMAPVCILLGGVITLGMLNNSNELLALKAGGLPLGKLTRPIIFSGLAVTLLLLAMAQFILPGTVTTTNYIWNQEVRGRVPLGIFRNDRYYYRGSEGFYSFGRPYAFKSEFLHFSYAVWDEDYSLNKLISSQWAFWKDGVWLLQNGQIQTRNEQGDYETEVFIRKVVSFPEEPSSFFISKYRSMELSLTGLFLDAAKRRDPDEQRKAWGEFHGRLSYIFLGLPLLIFGLPLLLIVYRKWGRDLSLAIPVSCGLAFVCWGAWAALQSLAKAAYIDSLVAGAGVHCAIAFLGLILLFRENT